MKRALLAALLTATIAGCALIIDLGDEPKLALGDAGVVAQTDTGTSGGPIDSAPNETSTPADTGTDSNGPPVNKCGLPPSPNAACAACIETSCCASFMECASTPGCVQGLDCIKQCLVQGNCINKCVFDFPDVQITTGCSLENCTLCTPGSECTKLGKCVFDLPRDSIVRKAQEGRILEIDEAKCHSARLEVASDGTSDAGVCFDP